MGVYKCPVCEGRGQVPSSFYDTYTSPTIINSTKVICRSCNGKGIVYDAEIFQDNVYNQHHQNNPGYMTFQCKGTCSNCEHNDRMVYTSNPVKYKCTLNNEWHEADYRCEHWCEQQQVYLQGKPVIEEWPCTTNCRLNATGTEDSTVEHSNTTNTTD